MSYRPERALLRGLTYERAGVMGMPDVVGDYCPICGKRAIHKHHMSEKGMGGGSKFLTLHGVKMESALIKLCPQCHSLFHAQLYFIEWRWLDMTVEKQWWDGSLFRDGLKPKDPILWAFGKYVVFKGDDVLMEVRDAV